MKNQCDGCQAGIPIVNGTHRMGREGGYPDLRGCTANRYEGAESPPSLTPKQAIDNMTEKDWEIIGLKATVAQQAKMIEHLRGGPTPLYTAVDMGNAARDERNGITDSLIERLAIAYPDSDALMTVECFADWLSKEMKA